MVLSREGKESFSPPSSWLLGQGKMQEVEEEQVRPWDKVQLMEISGRGQKWNFGEVAEGV